VPERKVHFSLYQRGRVRVGVNDISGLSFPPPAPPSGRGVFVQALINLNFKILIASELSFNKLKKLLLDKLLLNWRVQGIDNKIDGSY